MPDTKAGRERKGRNKRRQLESAIASRDVETRGNHEGMPEPDVADAEYLVDPNGGDEHED